LISDENLDDNTTESEPDTSSAVTAMSLKCEE